MPNDGEEHHKRLGFDADFEPRRKPFMQWSNQIGPGHLISLIAMCIAVLAAWYARDSEIAVMKNDMVHVQQGQALLEAGNLSQDARWANVVSDLRTDIRELRQKTDELDHALRAAPR